MKVGTIVRHISFSRLLRGMHKLNVLDGQMVGWIDGQMDGQTNGHRMETRWTDGQTDPLIEMRGRIYKQI